MSAASWPCPWVEHPYFTPQLSKPADYSLKLRFPCSSGLVDASGFTQSEGNDSVGRERALALSHSECVFSVQRAQRGCPPIQEEIFDLTAF